MSDRTRPKLSRAQEIGGIAEAFVAAHLKNFGVVFHPTDGKNDFGIDGRVELSDQGGVRGEEFFVQIKGMEEVRFNNHETRVSMPAVRIQTAIYWQSKLSPTLLLVYCCKTSRVFFAWAHEAIDPYTLHNGIRQGRRILTPRVSATNILNEETWAHVIARARDSYTTVIRALNGDGQSDLLLLYRCVADALDVLIDWLTAPILVRLPIDADLSTEASALASTHKPDSVKPPTTQVSAVILLFRTLSLYTVVADSARGSELGQGPLHQMTKLAAEVVRAYYLDIYRDETADHRRMAEVALYGHRNNPEKIVAVNASARNIQRGLALIAILARDYLRNLRGSGFEFPEAPKTDPINEMMFLSKLASSSVISLSEWPSRNGVE